MRGATARSAMQPRLIAERPKANLPTSGVCAPLDPERTPAPAQYAAGRPKVNNHSLRRVARPSADTTNRANRSNAPKDRSTGRKERKAPQGPREQGQRDQGTQQDRGKQTAAEESEHEPGPA